MAGIRLREVWAPDIVVDFPKAAPSFDADMIRYETPPTAWHLRGSAYAFQNQFVRVAEPSHLTSVQPIQSIKKAFGLAGRAPMSCVRDLNSGTSKTAGHHSPFRGMFCVPYSERVKFASEKKRCAASAFEGHHQE